MSRLTKRVARAGFDSVLFLACAVAAYVWLPHGWVAIPISFIAGARLNDVLLAATDEQVRLLEEQVKLLKGCAEGPGTN